MFILYIFTSNSFSLHVCFFGEFNTRSSLSLNVERLCGSRAALNLSSKALNIVRYCPYESIFFSFNLLNQLNIVFLFLIYWPTRSGNLQRSVPYSFCMIVWCLHIPSRLFCRSFYLPYTTHQEQWMFPCDRFRHCNIIHNNRY